MKDFYNVMEDIVPTLVKVMMHSPDYQTYCHCDTCINDICALTLNSLEPRYVTTEEKRQLIMNLFQKDFMRQTITKHIVAAIHVVAKSPNH